GTTIFHPFVSAGGHIRRPGGDRTQRLRLLHTDFRRVRRSQLCTVYPFHIVSADRTGIDRHVRPVYSQGHIKKRQIGRASCRERGESRMGGESGKIKGARRGQRTRRRGGMSASEQ